ncbi:MAG: M23 family metallopeptidase [Ruminococcaceae bacterium]|nr:M23 family metallopeptidase [Oscillospiraceae bacterium]
MKTDKKKNTGRSKHKTKNRAPYIGMAVAAFVGCVGFVTITRMADLSLRMKNSTPYVLPTPGSLTEPGEELATAAPVMASIAEKNSFLLTPTPSVEPVVSVAAKQKPPSLIMPSAGSIMTAFSGDSLVHSKTMGDWRVHNGIDIQSDSGAEVTAAAAGIIERAYKDLQMGYTIVVSHEGNCKTIYQNLASVEMVKVGDSVVQGQGIGAVGNSASAEMLEDSHLHFAVQIDDVYQNPMDYMQSQ